MRRSGVQISVRAPGSSRKKSSAAPGDRVRIPRVAEPLDQNRDKRAINMYLAIDAWRNPTGARLSVLPSLMKSER